MKIERTERKNSFQMQVELVAGNIGISIDKYFDGPLQKDVRINWPAIGSVNIAKAEQMIELLQAAVKEAKKL